MVLNCHIILENIFCYTQNTTVWFWMWAAVLTLYYDKTCLNYLISCHLFPYESDNKIRINCQQNYSIFCTVNEQAPQTYTSQCFAAIEFEMTWFFQVILEKGENRHCRVCPVPGIAVLLCHWVFSLSLPIFTLANCWGISCGDWF